MKINSIQKQLIYSTVRITAYNNATSEYSVGTGFFVSKEIENSMRIICLATNKHVIAGYSKIKIGLCEIDDMGDPDDRRTVVVDIELKGRVLKHPYNDVDLCFVFVHDILGELNASGCKPFFLPLDMTFFIDEELEESLSPIEDVIMIGYPEGLMDKVNNKPVVRKGITASSVSLDYNGKQEFLVDIACFPGSSGSPIFVEMDGFNKQQNEKGTQFTPTHLYRFIGLLFAGPQISVDGEIETVDIPTSTKIIAKTRLMMNLGYVIKARRVKELLDLVHEMDKQQKL